MSNRDDHGVIAARLRCLDEAIEALRVARFLAVNPGVAAIDFLMAWSPSARIPRESLIVPDPLMALLVMTTQTGWQPVRMAIVAGHVPMVRGSRFDLLAQRRSPRPRLSKGLE
jgi:hypothetical protein